MIELIEYNLPVTNKSWDNFKENHMVKITLNDTTRNESFWVWIESIQSNETIIGVICNNLLTNKLIIGQKILFHKKNIKEIANRSYTKEETELAILMVSTENNPITKYFESINLNFSRV